MPVRITCRGTKLSEELHDLVISKSRKLTKFVDKVERIEVIFTAEKHRRKCEINVHADQKDYSAHYENGDEAAAFDKALKAMQRQIKEQHTKMIEKRQKTVNVAKPTNRSGKTIRVAQPEALL